MNETGINAVPLLNQQQPPSETTELQSRFNCYNNRAETLFRRAGYFPFVSSVTGPIRAFIGGLGVIINTVCIPIFALLKKQDLKNQAVKNLQISASWILRGFVESKPFIGNAIAWSCDSLYDRIKGKNYLTDALYECRFIPLLSIVTGAIRSLRGAAGVATGGIAIAIFKLLQAVKPSSSTEKIILISHKFAHESLLEIPQGAIEMIPLCDEICLPLARIVEQIERQKGILWQPPHDE